MASVDEQLGFAESPNSTCIEIIQIEDNEKNEEYFKEFLRMDKEIMNEKVQMLSNMFSDAHVDFLVTLVKDSMGDEEKLSQLIESRLLTENYPKINTEYKKREREEQFFNYTVGFNVEKFISQFPEPFEYFENPNKEGLRNESVLKLLKEQYPDQTSQEIENIYSSNRFNLSLTINYFEQKSKNNKTLPLNIKTDSITLLQEIAFINNRTLLREYLHNIEIKIDVSDEEASLQCECCYTDELKITEMIKCENNHKFCKKCIIQATNLSISKHENFVKCLVECNKEFPLYTLKTILPLHIYNDLEKITQEIEISAAKLKNLESCPFCSFAMEVEDNIKLFKCKNPACMTISCRLCKKENHLPLTCDYIKTQYTNRLYYEEQLTKEYIRVCYNCKKPFVKNGGCNIITCNCGAVMCYICKKPVKGHDHLLNNTTGCR